MNLQSDLGTHLGDEDSDNRIVDLCIQLQAQIIARTCQEAPSMHLLTIEDGIFEAKATAGDKHLGMRH